MKDRFIVEGKSLCFVKGSTGKKIRLLEIPRPDDNLSVIPLAQNHTNPQKTVIQEYAHIAARLLVMEGGNAETIAVLLAVSRLTEALVRMGGRGDLWYMGEQIGPYIPVFSSVLSLFHPGNRLFCTEFDWREEISLQNCSGYLNAGPETAFDFVADHRWQMIVADGNAMIKRHSSFANLVLKARAHGLILVYFDGSCKEDAEELEGLGFVRESLESAVLYLLHVSRSLKKLVSEETKELADRRRRTELLCKYRALEERICRLLKQEKDGQEEMEGSLYGVIRGLNQMEDELYLMQPELVDPELPYWLNRMKTALMDLLIEARAGGEGIERKKQRVLNALDDLSGRIFAELQED